MPHRTARHFLKLPLAACAGDKPLEHETSKETRQQKIRIRVIINLVFLQNT